MRNVIYIGILMAMIFTGCSSQKKLQTETPFVLGLATSQKWVGGMEQSGTGYVLSIPITNMLIEKVDLQEVYFRSNIAKIVIEEKDDTMMVVAKYKNSKPDIIMHADPKEEIGNQPPTLDKKSKKAFSFELGPKEAILSFIENDIIKYVKITKIKEKAPKIFPAAKPRN